MSTQVLNAAKVAKNDEFYTQMKNVEEELQHYTEHFKDRKIYCNCDDPAKSNFAKYFKDNFHELGLRQITITGYRIDRNRVLANANSEHEDANSEYEDELAMQHGDFRSPENLTYLEEADIVVTNPPFSLLREYFDLLMQYNKKFLILANLNSVMSNNIFPKFKDGSVWFGCNNKAMMFDTPDGERPIGNACWWTNLKHECAPPHLKLSYKYKDNEQEYPIYDNYNAIDVTPYTKLPKDYKGEMGVSVTALCKLNPTQFKVIGRSADLAESIKQDGKTKSGRFYINGKRMYERIIIQRIEESA